MRIYGLLILTVLQATMAAQNAGADTLEFGSRAGMEVTIKARAGIGTSQAKIEAYLTEDNATKYCRDQSSLDLERCKSEYLQTTKLEKVIRGDCSTGIFTNFYGDVFQFLGRNASRDPLREFDVKNLKTNEFLDGSSTSGLAYSIEQFRALCPNSIPQQSTSTQGQQENPAAKNATPATARATSNAPGAIICADYATVLFLFRAYNYSAERQMQDKLTKGLSTRLEGAAPSAPDPAAFGCVLVDAGVSMLRDPGNVVPIVTVMFSDGTFFKGVTMEPMINSETSMGNIKRWTR